MIEKGHLIMLHPLYSPPPPVPFHLRIFTLTKEKILCSFYSLEVRYVNTIITKLVFSKILKVFEIDDLKAWNSVLISATSYALGLLMISKSPWYLLPLAWAWTGTALTGVSSVYIFTNTCEYSLWALPSSSSPTLFVFLIACTC